MVAFFVLLEDSTYFLRAFRPSSTPFLAASLASSLVFSTAASFTLLAMHFSASALLSLRILYQKSPQKSPQTGCRLPRQTDPFHCARPIRIVRISEQLAALAFRPGGFLRRRTIRGRASIRQIRRVYRRPYLSERQKDSVRRDTASKKPRPRPTASTGRRHTISCCSGSTMWLRQRSTTYAPKETSSRRLSSLERGRRYR